MNSIEQKMLIKYLIKKLLGRIAGGSYAYLATGFYGYIISIVAAYFYKYAVLEAGFLAITIDKKEDRVQYDEARHNLDQAVKEGKSNEEIKKLEAEFINRLRNHVKWA